MQKALQDLGVKLTVYDPYFIDDSTVKTIDDALKDATGIVIATGHDDFIKLSPSILEKNKVKIVVDGRNLLRKKVEDFRRSGIIYKGIGI